MNIVIAWPRRWGRWLERACSGTSCRCRHWRCNLILPGSVAESPIQLIHRLNWYWLYLGREIVWRL
ncbi:MAG: hypothetical protein WCJ35_21575 [Planctomycetota bacterium]